VIDRTATARIQRLIRWLEPFQRCFGHRAQRLALRTYVQGVFSDSDRKSMQALPRGPARGRRGWARRTRPLRPRDIEVSGLLGSHANTIASVDSVAAVVSCCVRYASNHSARIRATLRHAWDVFLLIRSCSSRGVRHVVRLVSSRGADRPLASGTLP
jgi:hypothetical protein